MEKGRALRSGLSDKLELRVWMQDKPSFCHKKGGEKLRLVDRLRYNELNEAFFLKNKDINKKMSRI